MPASKINGGIDVGTTPGNILLTAGAETAANTMGGLYYICMLLPQQPLPRPMLRFPPTKRSASIQRLTMVLQQPAP